MASNYTITANPTFNSIEITFDGKPSESIREALKALRFRWHKQRGLWYGYATEDEARDAIESADTEQHAPAPKAERAKAAKVKTNKFGVKVGDFFSASWGYDQTNNDFFQVIELVGESSVRVREVDPPIIEREATGPMAEDRVFCTKNTGELLPPSRYSCFIKDQEKGDLKRLKSYAADGKSYPQFYLASFTDAHYCGGDTCKVYESWYA